MNIRTALRISTLGCVLLAALVLVAVPASTVRAQTPALEMNVVYVCKDGQSFKVFSCNGAGSADVCDYQNYKNGQANQRGEALRVQLASLLPAKCHAQTPAEAQADPHRGEIPPRVAAKPNPNGASAALAAANAQAVAAQAAAARAPAGVNPGAGGAPAPTAPPLGNFPATDQGARGAATAEIARHWLKGPDGWTAAELGGTHDVPDRYLRQYRDLTIEYVEAEDISEADRMNGFEWGGRATFKATSGREAGGSPDIIFNGMGEGSAGYIQKQPGRWTQWISFTPGPLRFQRLKGVWQFQWDGTYLRGTLPGPQDFANAGVR